MEELIERANKLRRKAGRIALVGSSIYLDPTDDTLNALSGEVVIIKGTPFTKDKSKKSKDSDGAQ